MNFCTNSFIKEELSVPLETVTYGNIDYNYSQLENDYCLYNNNLLIQINASA